MDAASVPREQVEALLDELPPDRLVDVARFLQSLLAENDTRASRSVPPAAQAEDEAVLVEIARRGMSAETAGRLAELRARERSGFLSNGERHELQALEGRAERIDNERVAALLKLSRMRGVEVTELVRALGLASEAAE
ncbi:MAG: hypothetical protein R3B70_11655 [Polyangiaceae bacterium]